MEIVDRIIQFENGDLDATESVELISQLIQHGVISQLQGSYHRMMNRLIYMEVIDSEGTIDYSRLDYILEG